MHNRHTYPKPEVVGSIMPHILDEVRSVIVHSGKPFQWHEVVLRKSEQDGWIEDPDLSNTPRIVAIAKEIGRVAQHLTERSQQPSQMRLDLRIGGEMENDDWHQTALPDHAVIFSFADKQPDRFAYGKYFGPNFNHIADALERRVQAIKTASSLSIFQPNPFEIVRYTNKSLYTGPEEDFCCRTYVQVAIT